MNYATYEFTGDPGIPAKVTVNGQCTPVWIQQKCTKGEFAIYVKKNGCGHCCAAMALNLHGIKINPHEEFELCRKKWGMPRMDKPFEEDNFLSVSGICKILASFDVPAQCFGVPSDRHDEIARHFDQALREGKQIIFVSHPSDNLPDNPFSTGDHYVLAAGYTSDGKILIANSSNNGATSDGIQLVDMDTVVRALYDDSQPYDFTWGRYDLLHNSGYIVVG